MLARWIVVTSTSWSATGGQGEVFKIGKLVVLTTNAPLVVGASIWFGVLVATIPKSAMVAQGVMFKIGKLVVLTTSAPLVVGASVGFIKKCVSLVLADCATTVSFRSTGCRDWPRREYPSVRYIDVGKVVSGGNRFPSGLDDTSRLGLVTIVELFTDILTVLFKISSLYIKGRHNNWGDCVIAMTPYTCGGAGVCVCQAGAVPYLRVFPACDAPVAV